MADAASGVYLDANPLIYAYEGPPSQAEAIQELLRALRDRPGLAVTSELTLGEIMVGRTPLLKRMYSDLLIRSEVIRLVPVSRAILLETVSYRAAAYPKSAPPIGLRRNVFPDAIHVVTAIRASCRYFVTRDTSIRLPIGAGMELVNPDAASLASLLASIR